MGPALRVCEPLLYVRPWAPVWTCVCKCLPCAQALSFCMRTYYVSGSGLL